MSPAPRAGPRTCGSRGALRARPPTPGKHDNLIGGGGGGGAGFDGLPLAEALALAAAEAMTVDAALVTLDCALRRGLLAGAQRREVGAGWRERRIGAAVQPG